MRNWNITEEIVCCECGQKVDEEVDYDADVGHYICQTCGSESPDLENIRVE